MAKKIIWVAHHCEFNYLTWHSSHCLGPFKQGPRLLEIFCSSFFRDYHPNFAAADCLYALLAGSNYFVCLAPFIACFKQSSPVYSFHSRCLLKCLFK